MSHDTGADGWGLRQDGFAAETARAYEGLFTLGSGYLHTRGSLEESLAAAPQDTTFLRMPANVTAENFATTPAKWGTYVPGLFGPHPTLNTEMVNLPWFLELAPEVGGERLEMASSSVEGHERRLDLHTATLTRTLRWRTRQGATLTLRYERFLSQARPALSLQRLTLSADQAASVTLHAGVDGDVRTSGFDHLTAVDLAVTETGGTCSVETNGGDRCDMEVALCLPAGRAVTGAVADRRLRLSTVLDLEPGREVAVEKRTAVATSIDREPGTPAGRLAAAADLDFEALHAEHAALWQARWDRCDVVVDGDPRTQEALRTSLYHLLRTHVTGDARVAVDAKGYAGDAYFGRFFWDTEMYLMPFYLYTDPERARTFADFRVQSLPAVRRNAARYGYPGARFAWESDKEGNECCPSWQYCDHEVHVTADVVYGLEHYAVGADDPDYLRREAAETIVETARYWLARLSVRDGDTHPSLLGVMGPDEYTPISSNNAYTNWMVARNLRLAATVGCEGGATAEEIAAFQDAADGLPIRRAAENPELILQCEEWPGLADPEYDRLWPDRKGCYAAAVSQERLYRSKCLKQADVIMLQCLFPDSFTDAECRAAWAEYVPYTNHDSSLSAGIHAIMALRLGLDKEAYAYFQKGLYKDLEVEKGGAAEGIHIAGCGCNWMVVVFGFAGMKSALESDKLCLAPRLPARWTRLAFPVTWKRVPCTVEITHAATVVTNRGEKTLAVCVHGDERSLAPGEAAQWKGCTS